MRQSRGSSWANTTLLLPWPPPLEHMQLEVAIMSISCRSVSAFSTHRSSTAISTTDTCPYQSRIPLSVSLKMRLGGRQVETGRPKVRGSPQGLGPFLPADMPVAKHRCLPYPPRARHFERAPGHANRTYVVRKM
jgi:hypothetical protein